MQKKKKNQRGIAFVVLLLLLPLSLVKMGGRFIDRMMIQGWCKFTDSARTHEGNTAYLWGIRSTAFQR